MRAEFFTVGGGKNSADEVDKRQQMGVRLDGLEGNKKKGEEEEEEEEGREGGWMRQRIGGRRDAIIPARRISGAILYTRC